MKLYESTIKDTIVLRSDGTEISYLDIEWSYIIKMSNWLPLSILFILLLLSDPFTSLSWSVLTRACRNIFKSFEAGDSKEDKNEHFHAQTVFAEQGQITTIERVPTEQMYVMQIDKMNEFSVAFKYLCTCLPGNKILARKPIRVILNEITQHELTTSIT